MPPPKTIKASQMGIRKGKEKKSWRIKEYSHAAVVIRIFQV